MKTSASRLLPLILVVSALVLAGCDLLGGSTVAPEAEPVELAVPGFDEWHFDRGDWQFQDGKWVQTNATNGDVYVNTRSYAELEQKGVQLIYEWTIEFGETNVSNGPSAGMHIMSDNATQGLQRGNSYMIWQNKFRIEVYRTKGSLGNPVETFNVTTEPGRTHTYRVIVDVPRGNLTIYRDGELIGTVETDEPIVAGQYISARTNATWAAFSDIKVWAVE